MDIKHSHQTRLPKTWLILWDEIKESEKSVWIGLRSPSYWSTTTSHPWLPQSNPLYLLHSTCEQYWMLQWPFSVDVFQIIPLCCLLLTKCCSVCTLVRCTSFLRVFLRNGVTLRIAWCEHTTDSNTSEKGGEKVKHKPFFLWEATIRFLSNSVASLVLDIWLTTLVSTNTGYPCLHLGFHGNYTGLGTTISTLQGLRNNKAVQFLFSCIRPHHLVSIRLFVSWRDTTRTHVATSPAQAGC